jgi:hypothetical protein
MAEHLRKSFADEIKNAKYFSITVDSTPDVSHVDQLLVILRYMKPDRQIIEHFIFFFTPIKFHTTEHLTKIFLEMIEVL